MTFRDPRCSANCDDDSNESPYMQILRFLDGFIDELDYEAMTDFFLTFRTYLSPADLLDVLLTYYLQEDRPCLDVSKARKIRVFVALRHWILNYYADDFLRNNALRATMKAFLGRLGGIGADEITADAKIAKELRRVWDRESDIYGSNLINEKLGHRVTKLVRASWFHGDHAVAMKDRRSARSATRSSDHKRSSSAHQKILQHFSKTKDSAFDQVAKSEPESRISSLDAFQETQTETGRWRDHTDEPNTTESIVASSMPEVPQTDPEPLRKLRRKPGGNLKQMEKLHDLSTQSVPSSDSLLSVFIESSVVQQNNSVQEKYSAWLLAIIDASSTEDEEPGSASFALASALDCLEGRHSPKKGVIPQESVSSDEPTLDLLDELDLPDQLNGSAKRKRRAGIVQDTSASPNKLARLSSTPGKHRSTKEAILASPRSEEMVSMVEALAIPNSRMSISSLGKVASKEYTQQSSRILSENAALIAHSFGVVESAVFMELDWLELTSGLWIESSAALFEPDKEQLVTEDDKSGRALGTAIMTARFQRVVSWVIDQIKSCKDESERVCTLTKLIDVAVLCKKYNNFATLMQILTGLQSSSIRRMRRMWNSLPRDTTRAWKSLLSLCDDREDWLTLQRFQEKALFDTQNSIVPFVGCYLSQLLQIERQTAITDIISKSRAIAKITKKLLVMHDRLRIETDYDSSMVSCLSNIGL